MKLFEKKKDVPPPEQKAPAKKRPAKKIYLLPLAARPYRLARFAVHTIFRH